MEVSGRGVGGGGDLVFVLTFVVSALSLPCNILPLSLSLSLPYLLFSEESCLCFCLVLPCRCLILSLFFQRSRVFAFALSCHCCCRILSVSFQRVRSWMISWAMTVALITEVALPWQVCLLFVSVLFWSCVCPCLVLSCHGVVIAFSSLVVVSFVLAFVLVFVLAFVFVLSCQVSCHLPFHVFTCVHVKNKNLSGLGYGLPISRLYARYFGGELWP